MNLQTIQYAFQDLAYRFGVVKDIKLYMFNIYLQMADDELLATQSMLFNPISTPEANKEVLDILQPFIYNTSGTGTFAIPNGMIRLLSARTSTRKVDIITNEEYNDRKTNSLTTPSDRFPVVYLSEGNIITDPSSLIYYSYIKQNIGSEKPNLVMTILNEVPVYDSTSSVELKWNDYMYPKIIAIMLKYIGISVGDETIIKHSLNEHKDAS